MLAEGKLEHLPRHVREILHSYLVDLSKTWGAALEAVVLYGSAVRGGFLEGRSNLNLLIVLNAHDSAALKRYGMAHRRWSREGIVVPVLMTKEDIALSWYLFPLEWVEISQSHVVLVGENPFGHKDPDPHRLTLECNREIANNLIRLRQRYIEGECTPEVIQMLLPLSMTSLLPALRGVAYILKHPTTGSVESFLQGMGELLQMDPAPMIQAWHMKTGEVSPGTLELPRVFDYYVECVNILADRASQALSATVFAGHNPL